jgi:2-aminobenzoylacetyl-CoA thioesterase
LIFNKTGLAGNDLYVNGFTWSPTYLIAAKTAILFEAGFSCMGKLYEKDIKEVLLDQNPEFLFLTHVHYDHCGAAAHFKKIFPDLKICASQRAREILQRENAIKLISSLNQYAIPLIARLPEIKEEALFMEPFQPFDIDIVLNEEQTISIDDELSIQVFTTPGHTRDMLSYYIPEKKILIATESAGCLGRNNQIITEFLVDYDAYIRTLERFSTLDIDIFCQGHHFVFSGEDVRDFLVNSLRAAVSFKKHVDQLLYLEGGLIDKVVDTIKTEEYDTNPGIKQPERAYLLNLRTQITHLATRLYKQSR